MLPKSPLDFVHPIASHAEPLQRATNLDRVGGSGGGAPPARHHLGSGVGLGGDKPPRGRCTVSCRTPSKARPDGRAGLTGLLGPAHGGRGRARFYIYVEQSASYVRGTSHIWLIKINSNKFHFGDAFGGPQAATSPPFPAFRALRALFRRR